MKYMPYTDTLCQLKTLEQTRTRGTDSHCGLEEYEIVG